MANREQSYLHRSLVLSGRGAKRPSPCARPRERGDGGDYKRQRRDELRRPRIMGYSEVKELSRLDSSEMVLKVDNQLKALVLTMNEEKSYTLGGFMEMVLKVISKLTMELIKPENENESAKRILAEMLSDRSAQFHMRLRMYINSAHFRPNIARQLCSAFTILLEVLPEFALQRLPVDELKEAVSMFLPSCDELTQCMEELVTLKASLKAKLPFNLVKKAISQLSTCESWNNKDHRSMALIPSCEEISVDRPPARLRPNIINGPYDDWMHYFDVHFRLLREDFIAPLRRGVSAFLEGKKGKELEGVTVYHLVKIIKPIFDISGILYQLQFDNSSFRKCQWEHSKKLLFGSLLCLSPDNFTTTVLFATVASREPEDLREGILSIKFEQKYDVAKVCNAGTKFVMVESAAYFEASQSVLSSMQRAEIETMPFTRYIIKADCTCVKPPKYLQDLSSCSYNMSCLYGSLKVSKPPLMVNILNPEEEWPKGPDVTLDQSQLDAVKLALTHEVAVIQGPPGTGKTYVGLKVVEALLCNRDRWDPHGDSPILVICFTNHALDQFLENVLDIKFIQSKRNASFITHSESIEVTPRIARVGGRSQNERMQKLNVNQLLRQYSGINHEQCDYKRRIKEMQHTLKDCCIEDFENYKDPSPIKYLTLSELSYLVDDPNHIKQLSTLSTCSEGERDDVVKEWLGVYDKTQTIHGQGLYQHSTSTQKRKNVTTHEERKGLDSNPKWNALNSSSMSEGECSSLEDEFVDVQGTANIEETSRILTSDLLSDDDEIDSNAIHGSVIDEKDVTTGSGSDSETELLMWLDSASNFWWQMSPSQLTNKIDNVLELSLDQRWQLYRYWLLKQKSCIKKKEAIDKYSAMCAKYQETRQISYCSVLESQDVIGMTTTGAAKNYGIIQMLKPKIVIVEEAAEVLESHIISALSAGTQHLILIGDHMQLRPKPNEIKLADKFKLDISLFERLVINRIPHATLNIQHRMRPEIARLVHPHIYSTLYNHESVQQYEEMKGVAKNMFFISHEYFEEENNDLSSPVNKCEAEFTAALCKYLLQQGYESKNITVLTPYTGQMLELRNCMPKNTFNGVRISIVDNFQGEENDIILLSLVRSNMAGKIGFLKHVNRICVALSRAKKGFFCIGNFNMLKVYSPIWEQIICDMESSGFIGEGIPLRCQIHPEMTFMATLAKDFEENAPDGGCIKPCNYRLSCGHVCSMSCHMKDKEHKEYKCRKPCLKKCHEGHKCGYRCYEECPPCTENVEKKMKRCGHLQKMKCHQDPKVFNCQARCSKQCKNNHPCNRLCFEACGACEVKVLKTMSLCDHEQMVPCHIDPTSIPCRALCLKPCERGHPCQKYCYKPCQCEVLVEKVIEKCGHKHTMPCHIDPLLIPCTAKCLKPCERSHPCQKYCYQPCRCDVLVDEVCGNGHKMQRACHMKYPCGQPCGYILPCGHACSKLCHIEDKEHKDYKCQEPCTKKCNRGHKCLAVCSAVCPPCSKKLIKKIPTCGHPQTMECHENPKYFKCKAPCSKKCINKHPCPRPCFEDCGTCQVKVPQVKTNCDHLEKVPCYLSFSTQCRAKCLKPCARGHPCQKYCYQPCQCDVLVEKLVPTCGHIQKMPCHFEPDKYLCTHIHTT